MLALKSDHLSVTIPFQGEVQEWLNWLVSKTSEPAMVPRVRIPPSPPYCLRLTCQHAYVYIMEYVTKGSHELRASRPASCVKIK